MRRLEEEDLLVKRQTAYAPRVAPPVPDAKGGYPCQKSKRVLYTSKTLALD